MSEQITFATSDFASNPLMNLTPDWLPFAMSCLPIRWP